MCFKFYFFFLLSVSYSLDSSHRCQYSLLNSSKLFFSVFFIHCLYGFFFLSLPLSVCLFLSFDVSQFRCVVCTDFNQYYNLALLKDFERTSAAFGLGAPNDFVPSINPLKTTTPLKEYQPAGEPNNISKKPSSNYYCFGCFSLLVFFFFTFCVVVVVVLFNSAKWFFNEWFNS